MISVIIPVFNTGKALNKCINSVVSQTYKDIEVILVNDHSTDDITNSLIHEWVIKEPRIRLLDKEVNEGVDMARYSALQEVSGDYITFVDSDDWIEKDAFETLIHISLETGADVVIGKMRKVFYHGLYSKETPYEKDWMNRLILHDELMSKYFLSYFGVNKLPIQLWSVLFRTSVVKSSNIMPSGLKFGEDLLMSMKIFPHINSLYAVNKVVYNYNVGSSIISDKYFDNWLKGARLLYEKKMDTIIEMHYDKAIYYQKMELINYLKFYVYICCTRRSNQRDNNIETLKNEIQNPIYISLNTLLNSRFNDPKSVELIINGDAEAFYSYIEKDFKNIRKYPRLFFLNIITGIRNFLYRIKPHGNVLR